MPVTVEKTSHDLGLPTECRVTGELSNQGATPAVSSLLSHPVGSPSTLPPSGEFREKQAPAEGDPMERGYYKHWRKQEDSVYWSMGIVYRGAWDTILHRANWRRGFFLGQEIKPGEFACSVQGLADDCKISYQSMRTILEHFKEWGMISFGKLTSKSTKITICNWDTYNGQQQAEQRATNEQVTSEQRAGNDNQRSIEGKNGRIKEREKENTDAGESVIANIPTPEKIVEYATSPHCAFVGFNLEAAEYFIDWHRKKGEWPLRDWMAGIRNWKRTRGGKWDGVSKFQQPQRSQSAEDLADIEEEKEKRFKRAKADFESEWKGNGDPVAKQKAFFAFFEKYKKDHPV